MADELGKKKPDLGAGSSSMPAPKQASTPKPAPNTVSKPAPAPKAAGFSAPKQPKQDAPAKPKATNPFKGNQMPGFDGMDKLWDNMSNSGQKVVDNAKQQKMPNVRPDATQKKIMNQGFAPKQNPTSTNPKRVWDKNNNPGSAVTTKELEDFTRDYLKKSGGLSDEFINKTVSGLSQNSRQADFYKQKMKDAYEREQASEMFGTDLNKEEAPKKLGHDFDSLSKELDSGEMVNIDAGLLPYEHGFETSGNEDLAIDARKNEDGKYDLYMYPETENGPVSGYEEPAYTFDTFDELKSFVENGYKRNETDERAKASELFGTDLNKPDNNENIGFESDNEQDMNLYDFARGLGHDDATARTLVAHYKEGGDFAGVPRWKLEEIANGTADKNRWPFK